MGRIERGKEATPLYSHTAVTHTHCQGVTQVRTEQAESSLSEQRVKEEKIGRCRYSWKGQRLPKVQSKSAFMMRRLAVPAVPAFTSVLSGRETVELLQPCISNTSHSLIFQQLVLSSRGLQVPFENAVAHFFTSFPSCCWCGPLLHFIRIMRGFYHLL